MSTNDAEMTEQAAQQGAGGCGGGGGGRGIGGANTKRAKPRGAIDDDKDLAYTPAKRAKNTHTDEKNAGPGIKNAGPGIKNTGLGIRGDPLMIDENDENDGDDEDAQIDRRRPPTPWQSPGGCANPNTTIVADQSVLVCPTIMSVETVLHLPLLRHRAVDDAFARERSGGEGGAGSCGEGGAEEPGAGGAGGGGAGAGEGAEEPGDGGGGAEEPEPGEGAEEEVAPNASMGLLYWSSRPLVWTSSLENSKRGSPFRR